MSLVTEETVLGQLMMKYPEAVEVLSRYGVPATGCSIPVSETVGWAVKKYVAADNAERMLEELNSAADAAAESRKDLPDKIEVTEASVEKIKEIISKEKKEGFNLRIEVKPRRVRRHEL